ncbi:hypothetical protein BV22DRAFT_569537 [Leucogyrophana mollusca]|uniref:Uncharacterized protein n=1 Tax=Leucogyrophana mollusca TaxID=85980 RepID=A0ACB8BD29_9AGAM|nr:hypothetical protein BV22DRAFT_569537 [Leucogyrophana mollusca]
MILLGIVSSGLSCLIIGSGLLKVETVKDPAPGVPPGDGVLIGEEIVVLKGREKCVNVVTKGKFVLNMEGRYTKIGPAIAAAEGGSVNHGDSSEEKRPEYRSIGLCSLLLVLQFLLQLLLIPQGALIGQIVFLLSFVISWAYNSFLSSLEKFKIQADMLCEVLSNPRMKRYQLGTRTAMAVFVILELRPLDPSKLLNEFLPNDTEVWRVWKNMIVKRVLPGDVLEFDERDWPPVAMELDDAGKKLLKVLLSDATAAWDGYMLCAPNKLAERFTGSSGSE